MVFEVRQQALQMVNFERTSAKTVPRATGAKAATHIGPMSASDLLFGLP